LTSPFSKVARHIFWSEYASCVLGHKSRKAGQLFFKPNSIQH
jgi:hypothetical protein